MGTASAAQFLGSEGWAIGGRMDTKAGLAGLISPFTHPPRRGFITKTRITSLLGRAEAST